MKAPIFLTVAALCATLPAFGGITYTCDSSIDATQAGTCAYLNGTVAGLYNSTFTNANANIFIQMGITGLGSSTVGYYNDTSYGTYLSDLTANSLASGNAIQGSAVTALNAYDTTPYGSDNVVITSALAGALGITGATGTTGPLAGNNPCTIGTAGCYNGVITVTTLANLSSETSGTQTLYWDQTGGTQPGNAYDFYSVVQHETDEVLGTSSCISTQSSSLSNPCASIFGAGTPSAVDLFRYSAPGTLVLDSSLSTTPGAYFSYNGGTSNGANGAAYNTLSNGNDYADFVANTCGVGPYNVQDATGCPGSHPWINADGGAEINILNAVGYNLAAPEPATFGLLGASLLALAFAGVRRRARK